MFHPQLGMRFSEVRARAASAAAATQRRSFAMHFHIQQQAFVDVGPALQHAVQLLPASSSCSGLSRERAV
jgi:hypothetical protein